MAEPETPVRRDRLRSTHPVLSDVADADRWWAPESPAPAVPMKQVRFKSMDPFERFWWIRYVVVVLSLATPALILVRIHQSKIVRQIYDWNTDPVAQAQRCLDAGRAVDAVAPLKFACSRTPDSPTLIRALAAVSVQTSPAEARRCFHKLEKLGLATADDRAAHASLLATLQDFTGAKAVLSSVSREESMRPAVQRSWMSIWRESGDFAAAADALDKVMAANPEDVDASLDLAAAAAAGKAVPEVMERVQHQLLSGLSRWMNNGKGGEVLARAQRIVALPFTGVTCRSQAAQILRNLPGKPAEYRLAAVRLGFSSEMSASDEQALRRAYQDEIVWSGGLSAEDKDRVAGYLQQQREHELVAELIAQPEALTEVRLFHRRMASLLELGRWREAGAMAAAESAPHVTHSRPMLQALALLQDPGSRAFMAERLLLDSLACARDERRSVDCFATGCAALEYSLPNLASTAFTAALDLSSDRSSTMDAIMRSTRGRSMPLATLLRAFEGSAALHDESIQSQLIYLSLLAGRQVDALRDVIRTRRATAPDDVYLRFLEAFAMHQQGLFTQATQLLVPLPKYRWHQGEAAVIASIIAAAGNFDRSSVLLGQIDSSLLYQEERALVEPWYQRMNTSSALLSNADSKLSR